MNEHTLTAEQIGAYGRHLFSEDRAPGTREKYLRDIRAFARWLADRPADRELSAGWRELVLAGYALSCGYAPHTADGVGELLTAAPEGAAWRAENLRLTRAAEALASTVPEALPLSDRWDDLCALALVLGQRR